MGVAVESAAITVGYFGTGIAGVVRGEVVMVGTTETERKGSAVETRRDTGGCHQGVVVEIAGIRRALGIKEVTVAGTGAGVALDGIGAGLTSVVARITRVSCSIFEVGVGARVCAEGGHRIAEGSAGGAVVVVAKGTIGVATITIDVIAVITLFTSKKLAIATDYSTNKIIKRVSKVARDANSWRS